MVFVEDALFVGFVVPGETAAVLGGVAASLGHASLPGMMVTVVAAAIVGDSVGYEVGRHLGPRLVSSRMLRSRRERLDRAREFLARRGGAAVFLGRFVAFFRAVMPALAGTAGMRYRRFLAFNAAGGIVWGAGVVLLGYLAGTSYAAVERTVGPRSGPRRRRARHRCPGGVAGPGPSGRAAAVRRRSDELDAARRKDRHHAGTQVRGVHRDRAAAIRSGDHLRQLELTQAALRRRRSAVPLPRRATAGVSSRSSSSSIT